MGDGHPVSDLAMAVLRGYARVAPTGRGGYRLMRGARRLRPRSAWRGRYRTPAGLWMDLDLGVYPDCCMAVGLYELDSMRAMRSLLGPGDHFVDGGANIGYYTMLAARWVGPTGRIDAFEPMPATRRRLIGHLALNGLSDRVRVHESALADRGGETTDLFAFDEAGDNHGSTSMFARRGGARGVSKVATARLDAVLRGSAPRLIKLDLEGAEAGALRGAKGLLQSDRPPSLVVEFQPEHQSRAGESAASLTAAVFDARPGYRARILGRRSAVTAGGAQLRDLGEVNLLFWYDAGVDRVL